MLSGENSQTQLNELIILEGYTFHYHLLKMNLITHELEYERNINNKEFYSISCTILKIVHTLS